jgi:hypothetical protein
VNIVDDWVWMDGPMIFDVVERGSVSLGVHSYFCVSSFKISGERSAINTEISSDRDILGLIALTTLGPPPFPPKKIFNFKKSQQFIHSNGEREPEAHFIADIIATATVESL